jgi:hypothetical protein
MRTCFRKLARAPFLTVMVQNNFIEHSSRWFPSLVLVDFVGAELLQGQGVGDRFACRLNGELVMNITDGETLTVYRTNGNSPFFLRNSSQLGDVPSGLYGIEIHDITIFARERPQSEGPQRKGPHMEEPQREGPQREGPQREGPQREGPQREGPQREGHQSERPQSEGPQSEGPQSEGPQC